MKSADKSFFDTPDRLPTSPQKPHPETEEHVISERTFMRDLVYTDLDVLEALQISLPALRENDLAYRKQLAEFRAKLSEVKGIVLRFEMRQEAGIVFGDEEKIRILHQRMNVLEGFLQKEEGLEQSAYEHEELGGNMSKKELLKAQQTSERMYQDDTLLPTYLSLTKKLKTSETDEKRHLNILERRLGTIPEEIQQLASNPSEGLSVWRRGFESIRHFFDRNFTTTTQLLTTYRETHDRVQELRRRQQQMQGHIEGVPSSTEPLREQRLRLEPRLAHATERIQTILQSSQEGVVKTEFTLKDLEQLILLTQTLEEMLPVQRTNGSYASYRASELALTQAKDVLKKKRTELTREFQTSKGNPSAELIEQEMILFGGTRVAMERQQYEHLHLLLEVNPELHRLGKEFLQALEETRNEERAIDRIKQKLDRLSFQEQRAVATLAQLVLNREARVNELQNLSQEVRTAKNAKAVEKTLANTRARKNIMELFELEPLPFQREETQTTVQSRISRLLADLDRDVSKRPEETDGSYTRLISILLQLPDDLASIPAPDQEHIRRIFGHPHIQHALKRRGVRVDLEGVLENFFVLKRDAAKTTEHFVQMGGATSYGQRFQIESHEVERIAAQESEKAAWRLLPPAFKKTIPKDWEKFSAPLLRLFRDIVPSINSLRPKILRPQQIPAMTQRLIQEGVPSEIAPQMLDAILHFRIQERNVHLEPVWKSLPSFIQDHYPKEKALFLAPYLSVVAQELLMKWQELGQEPGTRIPSKAIDEVLRKTQMSHSIGNFDASNQWVGVIESNPWYDIIGEQMRERFEKEV